MSLAVTLLDDNRPAYLSQALASLNAHLSLASSDIVILTNDSGDAGYRAYLEENYPHIGHQVHHESRLGLAGALRSAWTTALQYDVDYVLHFECDFVALEDIPLLEMTEILASDPYLAQVSLKRQPVNEVESAVGGYIQCAPDSYWQRDGYVSHHVCYTFNPHMVSRRVIELCLDEPGDGLEHGFTETLLAHGYSFGIYGTINDAPRVDHVGVYRASGWKV